MQSQPPPGGLAPAVASLFQAHAAPAPTNPQQTQQMHQPQQFTHAMPFPSHPQHMLPAGGPPRPFPFHPQQQQQFAPPQMQPMPMQQMHQPPPHQMQMQGPPSQGPPAPQAFRQFAQVPQQMQGPPMHQFAPPSHFAPPPPQHLQHPQQGQFGAAPMPMQIPLHARQVSDLVLPPQVSGPGSLLSAAPVEESVAAVVGVALPPHGVLEVDAASKHLGGEEHAATPCTEYSSIPRDDSPVGCLIAHASHLTVFALKGGLARLVYQRGEEEKQMEVLKGHTSAVIDMAFMPSNTTTGADAVRHAATLSVNEIILWSFVVVDGRCQSKLVAKIDGQSFHRLRFQPLGAQYLAVIRAGGEVSLLDIAAVLRSGVSSSAPKQLQVSGIVDAAWSATGAELYLTSNTGMFEYNLARDAVAPLAIGAGSNDRVLRVPGSSLLLVASQGYKLLRLISTGRTQQVASSLTIQQSNIRCTGVEVDPTGSFVVVAYRLGEPTGESSDQGFFVLHLASASGSDASKFFDFATVFFQPSPILSFSIAAASSAEAASRDFDLFAVEQKPVVRLTIAANTAYRSLTAEEVRKISEIITQQQQQQQQQRAAAPSSAAPTSREPDVLDEEEDHHYEAHDAVPALRSSLPRLDASSETSPPSPSPSPSMTPTAATAAAINSGSVLIGTGSATNSASNSRIPSPGLSRADSRSEFEHSLDTTNVLDLDRSGRTSPASSTSPYKPMLRPRGNSTDARPQFSVATSSSQPTPTSTPAPPSTPIHPAMAVRAVSAGELGSPLPSPMPSPRGPMVSHTTTPTSPFPRPTSGLTAESSPTLSSPGSPLMSPSATPNPMDDSGVGGIHSIPSTPMHAGNSVSVTPAPTPLALSSGQRGSQLSTAEVSLQLLSSSQAVTAESRGLAGTVAPHNTPMHTPGNSVPSTPRLAGLASSQQRSKSSTSAVVSAASLRVRTQSGSTSPSPISSPLLHPHAGYLKARSASMDRNDLHGRLLGAEPLVEVDEDGAQRVTRPSSAAGGAISGKEKQEQTLMVRLDQLFSRHFGRLNGIVAQERMESVAAERTRYDALASDMAITIGERVETQVGESLMGHVEACLTEIVQDTVLPSMEQSITQAVTTSLGGGAAGDLTATILDGIRSSLQESFRVAFAQTLLPSFEASMKGMLAQIQKGVIASATVGASAAVSEQAARDAKRKAEEEEKRRLAAQAESAAREKARDQELRTLNAQMAEMMKLLSAIGGAQAQTQATTTALATQMADLAKLAARPSSLSVPTTVPPPPPATPTTADVTAEVSSLLREERFDLAFTRALSSGKLAAVLFACAQVDPRVLLSTQVAAHRLSAPVVLSLIQQLGCTLSTADDDATLRLKLLWLREAVMVVPMRDPALQGHAVAMLRDLSKTLHTGDIAQMPPTHELYDQVRMVKMMLQTKLA